LKCNTRNVFGAGEGVIEQGKKEPLSGKKIREKVCVLVTGRVTTKREKKEMTNSFSQGEGKESHEPRSLPAPKSSAGK